MKQRRKRYKAGSEQSIWLKSNNCCCFVLYGENTNDGSPFSTSRTFHKCPASVFICSVGWRVSSKKEKGLCLSCKTHSLLIIRTNKTGIMFKLLWKSSRFPLILPRGCKFCTRMRTFLSYLHIAMPSVWKMLLELWLLLLYLLWVSVMVHSPRRTTTSVAEYEQVLILEIQHQSVKNISSVDKLLELQLHTRLQYGCIIWNLFSFRLIRRSNYPLLLYYLYNYSSSRVSSYTFPM